VILSAEHVRLIRAGKKTEHRVPVVEPSVTRRTRQVGPRAEIAGRPQRVPHGPEVETLGNEPRDDQQITVSVVRAVDGKSVAVPECVIIVTGYQRVLLGQSITLKAARAEGHRTTDDYRVWWVRTYDKAWVNTQTTRLGTRPDDAATLARFESRHQFKLCWQITFRHDPAAPERFLAASPIAIEDDYTTQKGLAVVGEGAAVDETVQAKIAEQGREYDRLRKAGVDEADIRILQGMRSQRWELQRVATSRGINVRSEMRMLDQAENSFMRKIQQRTAHAA
jgi:hypothetical protein